MKEQRSIAPQMFIMSWLSYLYFLYHVFNWSLSVAERKTAVHRQHHFFDL